MPVFVIWLLLIHTSVMTSWVHAHDDLLSRFPVPQADFEKHVAEMREYLLDTQLPSRGAGVVEYNLPFQINANEEVPYRGRYLLIHGLNDSPGVWRDAALQLALRGYDTRAILLPGHGNTPNAQLNVTYKMWLDAARAQLEFWQSDDVPFYIGGFSLGGVIATTLALEYGSVDGLLLFAPAYHSTRHDQLRWASLVSIFKDYVFGGIIIEDNPIKYNSIPINAGAQYYKATRYLRRIWGNRKLSMPVLMVATFDDSVVSIKKVRDIFQHRFSSPDKRLVLYSNESETSRPNEIFRNSRYPQYRILNQSHQGMIISPNNPMFGVAGSVLVCNGNEWEVFSTCLFYRQGPHWHGAAGTDSPDGVPVARSTFNPDFSFLMELHDQIFDGVER